MKILHVLDHSIPLHSGYSFRTLSILREQQALGWSTVQLTSPKHTLAAPAKEVVDGFTFYRTPALTGRAAQLPALHEIALISATARRLEEVVGIEKPDIIHAHSPVLNALASLRVARRIGLPVVYEVRGLWEDAAVDLGHTTENSLRYRLSRALETYALRRCDAITTICDGLRQDLVKRQLPCEKITIIPNAVDPGEFSFSRAADEELRGRLELSSKAVLGSFYAYEGLDLLVQALPLVQLLELKDSWPGIQGAARRFVETERTWTRSVACYAGVYGRLVDAHCQVA
jgi:PEP-CTERM/exosortase A-associated glycosyltransferase